MWRTTGELTMNHQKGSAIDWFCIFAGLCLISTASRDLVVVSIIGIAFLIIGFAGAWAAMYSMPLGQSPQQTMPRLLQRTSRGRHPFGIISVFGLICLLVASATVAINGKLETLELTAKPICAVYLGCPHPCC